MYGVFCERVEAALLRYFEQSHSFTSIIDLSHRTAIPDGQPRTKVWATWFQALAQRSKEVAIIDRYGFSRRGVHGIYWTLESLGDAMSDGVVSIYSSAPSGLNTPGVSESDIANHIGSLLTRKPSSLKFVTVFMFADQEMTKDRYIKFDECAFSIGHGVSEAFRGEYLDRETPCILDTHRKGVIKIIRNEIQRLISHSHRKLRFERGGLLNSEDVIR